jgi:hypothetical protein
MRGLFWGVPPRGAGDTDQKILEAWVSLSWTAPLLAFASVSEVKMRIRTAKAVAAPLVLMLI